MNMFKKNGGFTLVELIVVIAILAILAGVAVPAYSGYIKSANDAADTTALAALKTAAMGAMAKTATVNTIEVEVDATTKAVTTVTANGTELYDTADAENGPWVNADFATYMNNQMITLKGSYVAGATWTAAEGWEVG